MIPSLALFTPPPVYTRIKVVKSFDELVTTPFKNGINALCWERTLRGDFSEVVERLAVCEGITTLDASLLKALPLSDAGRIAVDLMLEDKELLHAHGLSPVLDCIHSYPRDEDTEVVPTDVYSFHADSAPVAADTYLCTYSGSASEGLCNEAAQRRVDFPETRAELLKVYGGDDDVDFLEYLQDNCYNLHYTPISEARIFSFGLGNLWRIAIDYPGCPVPPCIHRAPELLPEQPPRLLLIS